MKNHDEDIDDGMEAYELDKERRQFEEIFKKKPDLFDNVKLQEGTFKGTRYLEFVLLGTRKNFEDKPFDFEQGSVIVVGKRGDEEYILKFRWEDFGARQYASRLKGTKG